MLERRCETCCRFVEWKNAPAFVAHGVCTAPRAEISTKFDRETRRYDGQKCMMWMEASHADD